ncbi:MAG: pancreas/duodenum homeobox protein 1 [Thermodesulfobacteriota bacterium]
MTSTPDLPDIFSPQALRALLPPERADAFFEALYGEAKDGAYDIGLAFAGRENGRLVFELQLSQRPGKCLACNLTYGLPTVFSRHPVINLKGLVADIGRLLGAPGELAWELGRTREISHELHVIPLRVNLPA